MKNANVLISVPMKNADIPTRERVCVCVCVCCVSMFFMPKNKNKNTNVDGPDSAA